MEVAERDQPKTAFCTTEGLFEFKVMPFGLCNASRYVPAADGPCASGSPVVALFGVLGRCYHPWEDIHRTPGEFEDSVRPSPRSRAEAETKVEKVAKWPTPTTTKEVQRFLGFASYYRRFIPKFADVAKPLHRLTERGTPFRWTKEGKWAFEELRRRLTTSPMLAYPDFERPFILDTDASDVGIGTVLSQIDDQGAERVIAYGSRVLSKPERRYCVTRRELLAVVIFTKHFRLYLAGRHFLLRTDHASLAWLRSFKEPEGQLARWLERLAEFDYKITHRQGKKHVNADALSRLPCSQCGRESYYPVLVAATPVVSTDRHPTGIREAQLADGDVGPVLRAIEVGEKPEADRVKSLSRGARRLVQLWDQLTLRDGILYRRYEIPTEQQAALQLVVPGALREEVLKDLHEGAGGHLGVDKTMARVKERFYILARASQGRADVVWKVRKLCFPQESGPEGASPLAECEGRVPAANRSNRHCGALPGVAGWELLHFSRGRLLHTLDGSLRHPQSRSHHSRQEAYRRVLPPILATGAATFRPGTAVRIGGDCESLQAARDRKNTNNPLPPSI